MLHVLNLLTSISAASYNFGMPDYKTPGSERPFDPYGPTGNTEANQLVMHNLGFFTINTSNITQYSKTLSFKLGQDLFKRIRKILDSFFLKRSIPMTPTNVISYFPIVNISLQAISCENITSEQDITLLYFFLDQMRTLISPEFHDIYTTAFESRNFDTCFSLLNMVFGTLSTEERAFLRAYSTRNQLVNQGKTGVLFVDVYNNLLYFSEFLPHFSSTRPSDKQILMIPNGILDIYKFYTYSMYLIDYMVKGSIFQERIEEIKAFIFAPYDNGSDLPQIRCDNIAIRVLAFKFIVYHYISLELSGMEYTKVNEFMAIVYQKMFAAESLKITTLEILRVYLNVILCKNKSNV
ncbi:hypothetical protein NUSPORA_01667 [Nucleospora cyclopteri]